MKNQYFGDVNDYLKYGLIRALLAPANLGLFVGWMLTPDDGSSDGKFRRYVMEPECWRHHDPTLYAHLSESLAGAPSPAVALIEQADVLPGARYFSELVPDDRWARGLWAQRLVSAARGSDLVFLDPDNGFEIPSKPLGRKDSSKYVAWHEVECLWDAGSSVLVYQHFPHEQRSIFTSRLAAELATRTGAAFVEAFSTRYVLFLLASQQRHADVFEQAIAGHLPRWEGQIAVAGLANNRIKQIRRLER